MAFIMHFYLSKSKLKNAHLLPESFSGCLKVVCAKFSLSFVFLLIILSFYTKNTFAESISITRQEAKITRTGQLSINTRFNTQLPEQLENALKQGVSFDFALSYQLERPTFASYRFKINQLLNDKHIINYRLSYHPLTNRYRVSVGTFSTEYFSLPVALKAIGAVANWIVLPTETLSDTKPHEIKANVRLSLSIAKLPKPFQINAINSKDWNLDSGWQPLYIK